MKYIRQFNELRIIPKNKVKNFANNDPDIIEEISHLSYILEDEGMIIKTEKYSKEKYLITISPNINKIRKYNKIIYDPDLYWYDYFKEDLLKSESYIEWRDRVKEICHTNGYKYFFNSADEHKWSDKEDGYKITIKKLGPNSRII